MPGQPEGEFDVTKLEAIETEPSGEKHPSFIFDIGENFQLEATFEGAGDTWRNLEFSGEYEAVAQFYAEGMGPGVPDQNFGTKAQDLRWPSPGEYKILSDTVSISRQGIYRCGVVVYLRDRDPPAALGSDSSASMGTVCFRYIPSRNLANSRCVIGGC